MRGVADEAAEAAQHTEMGASCSTCNTNTRSYRDAGGAIRLRPTGQQYEHAKLRYDKPQRPNLRVAQEPLPLSPEDQDGDCTYGEWLKTLPPHGLVRRQRRGQGRVYRHQAHMHAAA